MIVSVAERLKESKLIRGLRAKRLRPATLKSHQSKAVTGRTQQQQKARRLKDGLLHIMSPLFNNILYSVFIDSALFTLSEPSHY